MNEMENRAYAHAMNAGATWVEAMDFARWYWWYGRNGVAASYLEWLT